MTRTRNSIRTAATLAAAVVLAACGGNGDVEPLGAGTNGDETVTDAGDTNGDDNGETTPVTGTSNDGDPADQVAAAYDEFVTVTTIYFQTVGTDEDEDDAVTIDQVANEDVIDVLDAQVEPVAEAGHILVGERESNVQDIAVDGDVAVVTDCMRTALHPVDPAEDIDAQLDELVMVERVGAWTVVETTMESDGDRWVATAFEGGTEACWPADVEQDVIDFANSVLITYAEVEATNDAELLANVYADSMLPRFEREVQDRIDFEDGEYVNEGEYEWGVEVQDIDPARAIVHVCGMSTNRQAVMADSGEVHPFDDRSEKVGYGVVLHDLHDPSTWRVERAGDIEEALCENVTPEFTWPE